MSGGPAGILFHDLLPVPFPQGETVFSFGGGGGWLCTGLRAFHPTDWHLATEFANQ